MQTTIAVASPLMKNLCMSAISHLGAGGSAFIDIALMIRIRLTRLMVQSINASGACRNWVKVKTDGWRQANQFRHKMFEAVSCAVEHPLGAVRCQIILI